MDTIDLDFTALMPFHRKRTADHVAENKVIVPPVLGGFPLLHQADEGLRDLCSSLSFSGSMSSLTSPINVIGPPAKRRRTIPEAGYGDESRNIFLRMLRAEIPCGDYSDFVPIPAQVPPPDDFFIKNDDSRYLQYFLEKSKTIIVPMSFFFQSACQNMFSLSMNYKRLRHAIIAIAMDDAAGSSVIARRPSHFNRYLATFALKNEQPCHSLVRRPVSAPTQDAEMFALFLIFVVEIRRLAETKNLVLLRQYVKRLYKLLRQAQDDAQDGFREVLCPLLFYIWRTVMRINVTFALGVTHAPPVFPPPAMFPNGLPAQGHGPIRQFLGSASHEFEEWTLAHLELDDLGNRIFRMHLRASSIRREAAHDDLGERELLLNSQTLARQNESWKHKSVIQMAEYMEILHRQQVSTPVADDRRFLKYEGLRFRNPLYASLLLAHYSMTISLSLIVNPNVGPRSPERLHAAVEICKIYAALGGNHILGNMTSLAAIWWAGLVFDSRAQPDEAKWVRDQLADPGHLGRGMRYLTHLKFVWKKAQRSRCWDVWTDFPSEEDGEEDFETFDRRG